MSRYYTTGFYVENYIRKRRMPLRTIESFKNDSPEDYKNLSVQPYSDVALELIETSDSPYGLICRASQFIHEVPDALEKMRRAPRESLTNFVNRLSSDRFDNWSLHLYLKSRDLVKVDELLTRTLHYGDFKDIEEKVRAAGVEFETASDGFEHYALNLCEAQRKGMIHLVSLYFLRCYYGQQTVFEMLSKFVEAKVNWAAYDYVEILANWELFRDHTPQWISALVESQEIFDYALSMRQD